MATIEKIKQEIINFNIITEFNIIEVEFMDYVLEVDLKDMEQIPINKDTLASIIYKKYQENLK